MTLLGRIGDDAVDLLLGQEAEQVDVSAGDLPIIGECKDRNVRSLRNGSNGCDRGGKQGADNQFSALFDGFLRSDARAVRRPLIILNDELEVRTVEFEHGHLAGLSQAPGDSRGMAGRGQRQQHGYLDGIASWLRRGLVA